MRFSHADELALLSAALDTLNEGFEHLPATEQYYDLDGVADVLQQVATRMHENFPYQHPRYAGQMLKPPHPVARLSYMLSLWLNPNNHALDGGRASSAMEVESVEAIARMLGFEQSLGHLCGGGTMANLEALWVGGRLRPEGKVLASSQAHYTHGRVSEVLRLGFEAVPVLPSGQMDLDALLAALKKGDVGTVVATLGSTGIGAVDPLSDILDLGREYSFRVHVDAAYGGYFHLAANLDEEARRHFNRISEADSVVIDPHKHGLQPYGCGCILFRDSAVGRLYRHDSAYTYFSAPDLHLGEISLECSRPGAAAVALWATQQLLPMEPGGTFATALGRSLQAARDLWQGLRSSRGYAALMAPELDIVVFGVQSEDAQTASQRAREVFSKAAGRDLHLALVEMPPEMLRPWWPGLNYNRDTVTCLRSCLMKPEHLDITGDILATLEKLA